MKNTLLTISSLIFMGNSLIFGGLEQPTPTVVSNREMSLENRAYGREMNQAMKENILLTIAYMRGVSLENGKVNWEKVLKPFTYTFELKPGETFAFQKDSLPEYENSIKVTSGAHFNTQEGFVSDGYLIGDGVCHLASLFYWAAKDAGLDAVAPTNHNFMPIPEIPREYGVAIYSMPGNKAENARQNLYVRNGGVSPIQFETTYNGEKLDIKVVKDKAKASPASITQEVI